MLKISQNIEIIKVNLNTLNFIVNSLSDWTENTSIYHL